MWNEVPFLKKRGGYIKPQYLHIRNRKRVVYVNKSSVIHPKLLSLMNLTVPNVHVLKCEDMITLIQYLQVGRGLQVVRLFRDFLYFPIK